MFHIKKATINDLETVSQLFNDYRVFYRQECDLVGCEEFIKTRLYESDSAIFVALDDDDQGAGFTQLYPCFSSVARSRILILNDLYVHHNYRRMGVAALLLNKAVTYGKISGAIRLHLETEMTNESAQALYEKEGWIRDSGAYHYTYHLKKGSL